MRKLRILCTKGICRPMADMSVETQPISINRHSTDISIDTRPICQSTLGRYVGRYRSPSHWRSADTQPIPYWNSADTLPTLGQYSTVSWSALSVFFFLYSNCSCLRCPLHLVPALSVAFVLYCLCRRHSSMTFLSAYVYSSSSLLLQTLWLTELKLTEN